MGMRSSVVHRHRASVIYASHVYKRLTGHVVENGFGDKGSTTRPGFASGARRAIEEYWYPRVVSELYAPHAPVAYAAKLPSRLVDSMDNLPSPCWVIDA
ncbi:hypothetical protein GGF32_004930 [Allomyces javanicus]|nr:hypothetical protein GGF32_004930 [Allomyces javanicus]